MTTATTPTATSSDGTAIAYETRGSGPALVIAEGALCHRGMGTFKVLAESLSDSFTVVGYDRRGRGQSGAGSTPYEVQREVEDLAAVIAATGGDAFVLGASSGGALALEAARQGVRMRRLAVYEAPFILDGTHPATEPDLGDRIRALVTVDRRGEAVKAFLKLVGAPAPMVAMMPLLPVWSGLKGVAHTLPNDFAIALPFQQGRPLPEGHYRAVDVPTLVIAGGKSPEYLQNAQARIAEQVPGAELVTLKGQTHMVRPKATTPVLKRFFR